MNNPTTTPAMITLTSETCYGREQIRVALSQAVSDFYESEKESRKGDDSIDIIAEARSLKKMIGESKAGSLTVSVEWLTFAEEMEVSYAEYRAKTIAEAIERAEQAVHRWTWRDEFAK